MNRIAHAVHQADRSVWVIMGMSSPPLPTRWLVRLNNPSGVVQWLAHSFSAICPIWAAGKGLSRVRIPSPFTMNRRAHRETFPRRYLPDNGPMVQGYHLSPMVLCCDYAIHQVGRSVWVITRLLIEPQGNPSAVFVHLNNSNDVAQW